MQGLRKTISNAIWLVWEHVFRMGGNLILVILIARYLGPEDFGQLNYAIALVALFSAVAKLGLDVIVVRDLVSDPDGTQETLGTTFLLKLAGGVGTCVLLPLVVLVLNPDDRLTLILVAIISIMNLMRAFETIDFWFRSRVESKYVVVAKNIAFAIMAAAGITFVHLEAPLLAIATIYALELTALAAGLVIAYKIRGGKLSTWKATRARAKSLMKDSWPLVLAGMVVMIYLRIDQVMIQAMMGPESVGQYSAAVRISEMWYFLSNAIMVSVYPSIVELKKKDREGYYRRLHLCLLLMAAITYVIAGSVTFLSGTIINVIFGEEFSAAAPVLAIHIWASVFVFSGIVRRSWITVEGLMKYTLYATSLGAVINVAMNLVMIEYIGIIGAALSTLVSQAIASVGANALFSKTRPFFYLQVKALLQIGWLSTLRR